MNVYDFVGMHEGFRGKPYRDSRGFMTVGFGFCFDTAPITVEEATPILKSRVDKVATELTLYDWYRSLNPVRQKALIDMGYNLGVPGLIKFQDMINAIKRGAFNDAAAAMLQSEWAGEVGPRAVRDAEMMRTGEEN